MANSFASVEWLAQSSSKDENKDTNLTLVGDKVVPHSDSASAIESGYDSERMASPCVRERAVVSCHKPSTPNIDGRGPSSPRSQKDDGSNHCNANSTASNRSKEESNDASDEESRAGWRLRTAFSAEQITTLENTFHEHQYLGISDRQKLAAKLQLSDLQVKTWFQNRRMKQKREIQEGRQMAFPQIPFYNMYGYPSQPVPSFLYHPLPNPVMNPIPYSYPNPAPFQLMYMPQHQTFLPPILQYQEQKFANL